MKIYGTTLSALCVLFQVATAFLSRGGPSPAFKRTTAVLSSENPQGGTPGFTTPDASSSSFPPARLSETTSALEARLASLEKGQGNAYPVSKDTQNNRKVERVINEMEATIVQGNSLKTWAIVSPFVERVLVVLTTEGRPLDAEVELWQGPDNDPHIMRVYVEDGSLRTFSTVIETPHGPNTVAVRNIGQMEFPLSAYVVPEATDSRPVVGPLVDKSDLKAPMTIQGGALRTYAFDPTVESVRVLLSTDGRPLNARIELLQGPNNIKQVVELHTEDGSERPYYMIVETPGSGNVVRVVNTATIEFPLTAWVEPYVVNAVGAFTDAVIGGDGPGFMSSGGSKW